MRDRTAVAPPRHHVRTYDQVASVYDAWKWQEFWRRNEAPVVRTLLAAEPVAARALDIGAGTGALTAILRERARSVTAVDASGAMLGKLRMTHPDIPAVQGDAAALPFGDVVFDRIGAARLLAHLDDPLSLFQECGRTTQPGAAVVVTDLHPDFDYEQSTFGLGNAACSTPFCPMRHPLEQVQEAAAVGGLVVETLRVFDRDDLAWLPPRGSFATLDANPGPVFYVALFRRR